jgi:hypothetical protein
MLTPDSNGSWTVNDPWNDPNKSHEGPSCFASGLFGQQFTQNNRLQRTRFCTLATPSPNWANALTFTASKKLYKMRKMLFLLPYFLPGKARILIAHATARKTFNLGTYLAFQLHYAVLHARRAAKSLLVEEEFCTKRMQFYTRIFKLKYQASSSSSYLDKFLMRYVTRCWRKVWIRWRHTTTSLFIAFWLKVLQFLVLFQSKNSIVR